MNEKKETSIEDIVGDIGNFDLPDIDLNMIDFLPSDEMEETRYNLPKDTPKDKIRRIILKDNSSFGETDFDALINDGEEIKEGGSE